MQKLGSERWVRNLYGETGKVGSEHLLGVRACEAFVGAIVCLDSFKVKRGLAFGLSYASN
jgi:hypothetical protein